MSMSRVVKLEDVEDDQRSETSVDLAALVNSGRDSTFVTRQSTKSSLTKSSISTPLDVVKLYSRESDGGASQLSEAGALVEYIPSEAKDLLRPYPDGWPKLPAVLEARDYTTAQAPAVNLASAHLELLQNIIDDWFRTMTSAGSRPMSRHFSSRDYSQASERRHLRFEVAPQMGGDLALVGIGGKADAEKQRSSHVVIEEPSADDLPYLGAEQVVEEVINLLAKLENDRRDIHAEYKMEREKVKRLAARIDALAEKRLDMMPAAVQNEHEACARDIYELQWHISYRGRIRDRTVARREVAEALCEKLKEEIAYLQEQSPLIREKLELESDIMEKIRAAQKQTSDELARTVDKCEKLQTKSDETHEKAEQERQYMNDELISLNKEYEKISAELERVRVQHEKFLEKIDKTTTDISQCVEDTQKMTERNSVANENQKAASKRVRDLKESIHSHEQQQKELITELVKKQKKIDARKKAQTTVETKLQKNVDQLQDEYQFVHRIAQEFDVDIEDFERKSEECEKHRSDNEKRIEGIKRSIVSTGQELQTIAQEYNNVDALHTALSTNVAAEEAQAKKVEEKLRAALAGFKKQVNDEKNARAMLEANIVSDKLELAKSEEEGDSKKGKLENLFNELQKAVDVILVKVQDLRLTKEERAGLLSEMMGLLKQCGVEHKRVHTDLTNKKNKLMPEETDLKEENLKLDKQLDHLEWRSEMMNKKMKDMTASEIMMTRAVANTKAAIKEMTANLEEQTFRLEAGRKSFTKLNNLLEDTSKRNRQYQADHLALMKERQNVLEQHVKDLEDNSKTNTELAAGYRRLDNECMVLKDKLLNEMEEALQLENTMKDTKQLHSLQTKMHSALCEYLKHRGLYMQTELDFMSNESYTNCAKVKSLYGDINSAMDETSAFLVKASMDQSKARETAEEAVKRQEALEMS